MVICEVNSACLSYKYSHVFGFYWTQLVCSVYDTAYSIKRQYSFRKPIIVVSFTSVSSVLGVRRQDDHSSSSDEQGCLFRLAVAAVELVVQLGVQCPYISSCLFMEESSLGHMLHNPIVLSAGTDYSLKDVAQGSSYLRYLTDILTYRIETYFLGGQRPFLNV